MKVDLTKEEAKILHYVIGSGYGDGDIFQEGLLDTVHEQQTFWRAWEKIKKAM